MSDEHEKFEGWAILELMGHRRLAGYVQEATLAGGAFIRIDVPAAERAGATCEECGADTAFGCICAPPLGPVEATQFYAPAAVYCITPTTEQVARAVAVRSRPAPVQRWELPAPTPTAAADPNEAALDALEEDLDEQDTIDDQIPF